MDNAGVQDSVDDVIPRWVFLVAGLGCSFAAVYSIWSHGLTNWDWVQNASLALVFFSFFIKWWDAAATGKGWRSRVFWIAYGVLFGAWIGHENGWVFGGCIILFFTLPATACESGWWSFGIKKPLGILELAIVAVGVGWFIATTKDWVPFICVVATILLLAEKQGRRSMRENLLRVKSIGWIATFGLALYWLWKGPSFASVLAIIAIPVLWFGSLLLHLSSGERSVALSHPQS
jgi:hypothetical protein